MLFLNHRCQRHELRHGSSRLGDDDLVAPGRNLLNDPGQVRLGLVDIDDGGGSQIRTCTLVN